LHEPPSGGRRGGRGHQAESEERRTTLRPRGCRCRRGGGAPMVGGSKEPASRPCRCGRRRARASSRAMPLRPCSLRLCYS
jgi:hypothetical protein